MNGRIRPLAVPPVVGIDGCRDGWVIVTATATAGGYLAAVVDDLGPTVAALRAGELAAVAIDMPIGLLDHQPRACDVAARRLLGPRRSSVFPAPVRDVLDAEDYDEACRRSRAVSGKALSKQAFNLVPKIAAVDRLVVPSDQDRLVEAHPECAFARLGGGPCRFPKRTPEGRAERIDLLAGADRAMAALVTDDRGGLPLLDLIDAAVLTVTAGRVAAGVERRLGPAAGTERDRRGLRAEIVL
ncbi:MAG: DUF429 domain-containing protein [Actinomycetota bacterium]